MPPQPRPIGDILKERNIELSTNDPIVRGGFTQIPNFILKDENISIGAKVVYAMLLSYYWHDGRVFPGQNTLAGHLGMSVGRVNDFIKELEAIGLIDIKRLGQGRTNRYLLHSVVKNKKVSKSSKS